MCFSSFRSRGLRWSTGQEWVGKWKREWWRRASSGENTVLQRLTALFLPVVQPQKKKKKRKTRVFLFPLLEDNVMLLLLFFFPLQCSCAYFLFHNKHLSPLINEKPTTLSVLRTTLSFFFLFFFRSLVFSFPVFFFFWFIFHRGIECWPEGLCTLFLPADLHRTTDRAVRVRQPLLRMNQMCVLENGRRCYCTLRYVSQPFLLRIIFYNGKKNE